MDGPKFTWPTTAALAVDEMLMLAASAPMSTANATITRVGTAFLIRTMFMIFPFRYSAIPVSGIWINRTARFGWNIGRSFDPLSSRIAGVNGKISQITYDVQRTQKDNKGRSNSCYVRMQFELAQARWSGAIAALCVKR